MLGTRRLTQLAEGALADIEDVKGWSAVSEEEVVADNLICADVGDIKGAAGKDERSEGKIDSSISHQSHYAGVEKSSSCHIVEHCQGTYELMG